MGAAVDDIEPGLDEKVPEKKNPRSSDGAERRLPVSLSLSVSSRYFEDGKELVAQIQEKLKELPDDVGEDFSKAESFHRMHAAFERDITALGRQVRNRPRHDECPLQAGGGDATSQQRPQ